MGPGGGSDLFRSRSSHFKELDDSVEAAVKRLRASLRGGRPFPRNLSSCLELSERICESLSAKKTSAAKMSDIKKWLRGECSEAHVPDRRSPKR